MHLPSLLRITDCYGPLDSAVSWLQSCCIASWIEHRPSRSTKCILRSKSTFIAHRFPLLNSSYP